MAPPTSITEIVLVAVAIVGSARQMESYEFANG
jgi:hypothetical protein